MFKKVLVANRGEIALRVLRACREMGIATVAVFSEADADSLYVKAADEAVCIGPPRSRESYLHLPRILSAVVITNADAVHPGYGFLAENAQFAEACESSGITFIGPPSSVIRTMGDKAIAKEKMRAAGVPVLPGSVGVLEDPSEAAAIAERTGFPVILKAKAGGGGKGMRIVRSQEELERLFTTARSEAEAAFADGALYLEKYLEKPRHIEIQIVADKHGNVLHLGERDCSIQRRHQKLIEESPSPALDEAMRAHLGATAVRGAAAVGYQSLGTIEFLFEEATGEFYFMEMNTRLQVEHPVTELVTRLDLVEMQIRIAAGEPLALRQEQVRMQGHAIECRINAEDPAQDFRPCPGLVRTFHLSGGPGVRIDSNILPGSTIPPYYDSMVAKLIVHASDRPRAIARMERALGEAQVEGIETTIPFHREVLKHPDFRTGRYDTGFIARMQGAREEEARRAAEAPAPETPGPAVGDEVPGNAPGPALRP
ncbi:MAG: acetyl-CoA carboxylase biotin carboxylase subunit [Candidatus Eisenbacteria bacterium]